MAAESTNAAYTSRYVAFLDILGFQNLVDESASKNSRLFQIASTLSDVQPDRMSSHISKHIDKSSTTFGYAMFSDSIVLYDEMAPSGLWRIIGTALSIAETFEKYGVFCRGGIASGQLFTSTGTDRQIVFGPAFIAAYKMESGVADVPRIVVSKQVLNDIDKYASTDSVMADLRYDYVRLDEDGVPFLDMVRDMQADLYSEDQVVAKEGLRRATRFRRSIVSGLRAHISDPPRYRKYKWLRAQFNRIISHTISNYRPLKWIDGKDAPDGLPPLRLSNYGIDYDGVRIPRKEERPVSFGEED